MKKIIGHLLVLALLVSGGTLVFAQQAARTEKTPSPDRTAQAQPDRVVVPLSNPAKPAKIEASLMRGSITVKGYDGKDVIVEARVREKALGEGPWVVASPATAKALQGRLKALELAQESLAAKASGVEQEEQKERSHEGMKLITSAMTGLSVEEDNNTVTINTQSWKYAVDLTIQVPVSSSLELGAMNDGKVIVENVNGDIEVGCSNGRISLRNVAGSVVAHTVNGDIEVVFTRVSADKPLSFSNMNGDIDITLPADVKASVRMKSQQGNIYSDFDVALKTAPTKVEGAERTEKGQFRINFDKGIYGTINGGGREITLTTFNGDIFIRKQK
ncbi:MAG: DUF4097 family beta strand repeat-containing protein [Candidatus Aminicenantales bacterium]